MAEEKKRFSAPNTFHHSAALNWLITGSKPLTMQCDISNTVTGYGVKPSRGSHVTETQTVPEPDSTRTSPLSTRSLAGRSEPPAGSPGAPPPHSV